MSVDRDGRGGGELRLHADRLLPSDPRKLAIAQGLYEAIRALPVVSPHGHVDPRVLLDDEPFTDPAALLVTPDHYVTRLRASGVALAELGVGQGPLPEAQSRHAWRMLCERWAVFAGTPVRGWLEAELAEIFQVELQPSARTADAIYDAVAEHLTRPEYRPRALFSSFGIDVLATTDDPCSPLTEHAALRDDPAFRGRVIPTFRPDRYLEPGVPGWPEAITRLAACADIDTGDYAGFVGALQQRRHHFIAHGATACDHSHLDVRTDPLDGREAARIYRAALAGEASEAEAVAFRRHMLLEMARMSCEDGLVMTLHPGVRRNHHRPTLERFGPDTGHDIPVRCEFTDALAPLLERFGTCEGFHLVAFTVDETAWSRELAPLAGFYPSVYVGVRGGP